MLQNLLFMENAALGTEEGMLSYIKLPLPIVLS